MSDFNMINKIMASIWGDAINKQLNAPNPLLPKSDKPPLHGPPEPALLVRDLIKRLSACDPDARVWIVDYEYGPLNVYNVRLGDGYEEGVVIE